MSLPGQPIPTPLDRPNPDMEATPREGTRRPRLRRPSKAAAFPELDRNRIGIVCVHGIGSQRPGETLLDWTAPIVRCLGQWRTEQGSSFDPVIRTDVDLTGQTTPLVELHVPAPGDASRPAQRWVFTEAFWASNVRPPGYREMLHWLLVRGEFLSIVPGIVRGINIADARREDAGHPPSALRKEYRLVRGWIEGILIAAMFLLLAFVAAPVYLLLKVLQAIPVAGLADKISTAQLDWFLTDWFGDVRVLLADRVQAENIRACVLNSLGRLQDNKCGTLVVVSHSGGTVLAYMSMAEAAESELPVDAFVTHAQAIGLAWRLGHLVPVPAQSPEDLQADDRLASPLPASTEAVWHDFWATHDPAPAGPLTRPTSTVSAPDETRSYPIVNRNSVKNDHGGYWDNDEEFVIPLMRLIDKASDGSRASRFDVPNEIELARVGHRETRVHLLSLWWNAWMALLAAAVGTGVFAQVAARVADSAPAGHPAMVVVGDRALAILSGIGGLLPSSGCAPVCTTPGPELYLWVAGLIAIVALAMLVSAIGVGRWNDFDVRERRQARNARPVWPSRLSLWVRGIFLLIALVALVVIAGTGDLAPLYTGQGEVPWASQTLAQRLTHPLVWYAVLATFAWVPDELVARLLRRA